jgi:hypothetical protein
MKNLKYIFFGITGALVMTSCSVTMPVTATNNPIGSRKGKSSSWMLGVASPSNLGSGIVFNKNYGLIEAVKKGKIERVATVDLKITNYYIVTKAEILVTGE